MSLDLNEFQAILSDEKTRVENNLAALSVEVNDIADEDESGDLRRPCGTSY